MAYDEFTAKIVRERERLEQENAQLKAELVTTTEKLRLANIDQLQTEAELANMHEQCTRYAEQGNIVARELTKRLEKVKAELAQCQQQTARLRGIVALLTTGEPGSFLATRCPATLREAMHAIEEGKV